MYVAKKIKKEREKRGWSQVELAEQLYVSRQSVSKWETGKNYPSIEIIIQLSELFQITTDELLRGEYVMSKVRSTLLVIAAVLVLVSALVTNSLTAFIGGVAGLIGIATWGYSSKEATKLVKAHLKM